MANAPRFFSTSKTPSSWLTGPSIFALLAEKIVKASFCFEPRTTLRTGKPVCNFKDGSKIGSPHLFNTLVETLIELPLPRSCELTTYEDDITLVCTGPFRRTHSPRETLVRAWFQAQPQQIKAMAFGGPIPNVPLIRTARIAVEWVENHQYLGVWLDRRLTQDPGREP
ncbi:hypothetical protein E2C01_062663 [Portunus trituberculatus]|uniref:Uncharacterized protein n=1 Tax=Portunus trituberculatus TaxID=210409 RepID=A0A5B7H701_PORTR|nr:hypothetical protein [Portunus trituberculatus]